MPANKRGKPTGRPLSAIKQQLALEAFIANEHLPSKSRVSTESLAADLGISDRQVVRMRANLRRYGWVNKPTIRGKPIDDLEGTEKLPETVKQHLKHLHCGSCGNGLGRGSVRQKARVVPGFAEVEARLEGFDEVQVRGLLLMAVRESMWVERLVDAARAGFPESGKDGGGVGLGDDNTMMEAGEDDGEESQIQLAEAEGGQQGGQAAGNEYPPLAM